METTMKRFLIAGLTSVLLSSSAITLAQSASDQLAEYRKMLADGNPAELYEAEGEELWEKPAGPKKASLEKCDLGLGPGVVKGASAQLPRYFADTNRVQDLESRLMTCMTTLQGIPEAEMVKGMKINVSVNHPKEKEMLALGEKIFYLQGGPMDFSCASCHAVDDKRIRMQDLPNLTIQKGAAEGWGNWPAYRVSSGTFWTMQQRLNDCYRQQRMPFPIYGSDVTIALSVFMANTANGGTVNTPGLKR
jgi:sulfur-oxidizing protein SoxA